jgi:hypothetical protein
VTQPLHVEGGALNYSTVEVVDRDTGAVGPVTQTWNLGGNREYQMEAVYSVPVLEGRATVEGFGEIDMNPPTDITANLAASLGGRVRIAL